MTYRQIRVDRSPLFEAKPSATSPCLSNGPDDLVPDYYCSGVEADIRESFKSQTDIPNPVQLLWIEKIGPGSLTAATEN